MNGSKAVLWVWLMKDVSDRYTYSFKGNLISGKEDSYGQMREIFEDYSESLKEKGLNVAEHCARTWIYVRDVDVNYAGIVKARRELFDDWGLKADTHYLASTGINGLTQDHRNLVSMDTYTVTGLKQSDIQYLHALENLSPTHIYGVTFERGTALHFEDRTQVLISGTASIDKEGQIVAPGDIIRQTERTFENIKALLAEAGAGFESMAQMIVYIRDTADYRKVESYISEHFPNVPKVITWAPVCRPGWLVEVECVAYIKNND
jgi:enamine deaminase RidA (YjgF/YER057c/UK114 family)